MAKKKVRLEELKDLYEKELKGAGERYVTLEDVRYLIEREEQLLEVEENIQSLNVFLGKYVTEEHIGKTIFEVVEEILMDLDSKVLELEERWRYSD